MAIRDYRIGFFNRLGSGSSDLTDDEKDRSVRQGLLGLAAGLAGTGGGFGNALANGIQTGLLAMNDSADSASRRRYQQAIMARTQQGMERNAQIEALQGVLAQSQDPLNSPEYRQLAALDAGQAKAYRDAIDPQARWQLGRIGDGLGGEVDVLFDPMNPSKMRTIDGQPIGAGLLGDAVSSPTPQFGILRDAVEQVESGGNPSAVSPAGAIGPMQTMPGTLRDPGFGVAPARDNSIAEQRRVGNDYLRAMTDKYGLEGGLAAYNWGPGNWEASLSATGGNPQAALARAPQETRDYVPKVLGRAGMGQPQASGYGRRPAKAQNQQDRYRTLSADEVQQLGLPSGTVAQLGPTGQIQIVNKPRDTPTAGSGTVIDNGDGTTTYIPAGKISEGERNAAGFYQRMVSANGQMDALTQGGYDPTSLRDFYTAGTALGNFATTSEGQQYRQAQENWVRANLRKESGAAIGKDEMAQERRNYFPIPGDSPEVIAQKAAQRRVVEQAMRTAAGGALAPPQSKPREQAKPKRLKFNPQTGKIE